MFGTGIWVRPYGPRGVRPLLTQWIGSRGEPMISNLLTLGFDYSDWYSDEHWGR